MTKKLLALFACAALAAMCLAGCGGGGSDEVADQPAEPGADAPVAPEGEATQEPDALVLIGDPTENPQFVQLVNESGADITAVMIKPSTDEAFDGPLAQQVPWATGSTALVHYNAIEAEPRYDLRFEFSDGSDTVSEDVAMFDVVFGTVTKQGLQVD